MTEQQGNSAQSLVEQIIENQPQPGAAAPGTVEGQQPDASPQTDANGRVLDPTDPDDAELIAAREAAAGKPAAQPGQQQQPAQQTGQPAAQGQPGQQQPAAKPKPTPSIPLPRFKEVEDQMRKAERAAAYWKGQADASRISGGQQPQGQNQTHAAPTLTPQQQLDAVKAERIALASKFDRGEIEAVDMEKQRLELEDKAETIRAAMRSGPAQPQGGGTDLYLEALTDQLERKHPYSVLITEDRHWDLIHSEARAQLAAEGKPLPADKLNPTQTLLLRTKMAELTDTWGPTLTGKQLPAPGTTAPPAQGQQPQGSKTAQQRLQKLADAASAPPNLTAVGQTGNPTGEIQLSSIENMDEDAIAALPQSTRDKLFGRQPSQR